MLTWLREVESQDDPSVAEGGEEYGEHVSERWHWRQKNDGARLLLQRVETTREAAVAAGATTFEYERVGIHTAESGCRGHDGWSGNHFYRKAGLRGGSYQ